jgi:hypothetical protein
MIWNFEISKSLNIQEKEDRSLRLVIKIACKLITTVDGISSVLKTEQNNIVSEQSARKYKENVAIETKDQGSLFGSQI